MLHLGPIDIRTDVFLLILAVLCVCLEFFICQKTKKRFWRVLPIGIGLISVAGFLLLSLFLDGWDFIGSLFLAFVLSFLTFSLFVGYGVWRRYNKKRKK